MLWEHRTDPLEITLYVDALLVDRTNAWGQYDEAASEIDRRYQEAEASEPKVDDDRYVWWYDRNGAGEFIPRDPEAPAWSWDAFRSQPRREWETTELIAAVEESLRTGVGLFSGRAGDGTSAYIVKSEADAVELWRLEDEREAKLAVFSNLEDRLAQQRLREWSAYGEMLKARLLAHAAAVPGLSVPVTINVDVDTFPAPNEIDANSLEGRLINAAAKVSTSTLMDTPTPEDLAGTPLERLERQS
jgi:hypothetical protein